MNPPEELAYTAYVIDAERHLLGILDVYKRQLLEEDNRIQLFISGDGLRAELVVKKPLTEEELSSYEELKDFLTGKGIVAGIKEEVLEEGKKLLQEEGRYLIAEGKRPQRGKDGEVKVLFTQELEKRWEEDESGRVDLFDFVKIPEVKDCLLYTSVPLSWR